MINSFKSLQTLSVNDKIYHYYSLKAAEQNGLPGISKLPYSLKILLENQLRHENNLSVKKDDILAFLHWLSQKSISHEIAYHPARVLMQDFTGVPAVVDLAAMRNAMVDMKGDPTKINPLCTVDLVIDHSVQVDHFSSTKALQENVAIEMKRNHERYAFLKWGQDTFQNFQLVPPGTGICHQVNLEYLGQAVCARLVEGQQMAYPDTLVGTDSHTTMINALGVLGWGVGGIEAEAAMLGQPISMLIPDVIGFHLEGSLTPGVTATDLVLTVTQMLRKKGVVGRLVEFYGPGLSALSLADRATIANMAPEYGATCGLFPIDAETLRYMQLSNRDPDTIALVKAYSQAQGIWYDEHTPAPEFTDTLQLNLSDVVPCLAGPKRPQDRVTLKDIPKVATRTIIDAGYSLDTAFPAKDFEMHHGDVVIAAITSCTNTSNPSVMLAAGLLAKKAVQKGLKIKPWTKCSLAPGSKVVTDYLEKADLLPYLNQLGFYLVGYGCTTCIGNSGPLSDPVTQTVTDNDMMVSAVLSGNRNFEGRIHPLVKSNWLASPPLVVAYALAGSTRVDLLESPLGQDKTGSPVYLKDLWPSPTEISQVMPHVSQSLFSKEYACVFQGDTQWQQLPVHQGNTYDWQPKSTYIKLPPFFQNMPAQPKPLDNIYNAKILALLGDSVTTDHISPAGAIKPDSPAGEYLQAQGIKIKDFNSYGARRGNHEVMMRGTFANIRIRNEMLPETEGGFTQHLPSGQIMSIYDAAMAYQKENIPLVIIAGQEYGTGSSRDWAAKGTSLLGIKAVIAESFERIHRSNLIGMGVLPLVFKDSVNRRSLALNGSEILSIEGMTSDFKPGADLRLTIKRSDGSTDTTGLKSRIDTSNELQYYCHGGILHYVLRRLNGMN